MSGNFSLGIIGGGPAGLFCALQAAGEGLNVVVFEKKRSCGNKLLISGSGQCNVTHDGDVRSFLTHYGENASFLKPALMNFSNQDLIRFFNDNQVPLETEIGGKVFPVSRKASDILDLLVGECRTRGVEIRSQQPVVSVSVADGRFLIQSDTDKVSADALVVATGGDTYPATGSTGDGFRFARDLGHQVAETGPALTGVYVRDYLFTDLSGISFADRPVSLFRNGKKIKTHTGDILFTHTGLSGPGILDFSRFIRPADTLRISFMPGTDAHKVNEDLVSLIAAAGNRQVKTVLGAFDLPDRFIRKIMELAGVNLELTAAHLSKKDRGALVDLLTACPFVVARLGGPDEAMVTRGGVELSEVNPKTMESRIAPGLFFVGEVLDIDGDTGGYNLQAAFSTAVLAAKRVRVIAGTKPES